ncbi:MAG: hypothetical protein JWM51_908 [Microbacteriaceae bacterium]|jgi:hypothetical protein|nr:hypothetical protein [Microbacteriaceae bacterium]
MRRLGLFVIVLRVFLASLFGFLVLMQVMSLPGEFAHDAQQAPDRAHLAWAMLAVTELEVVCVQVVIVCTWRLLTMVTSDRIFSEASFVWVNWIVWSFVAGWLLLAGLAAYLAAYIYFTPELRDPGVPILLFGTVLVGAVFVLLVGILRALLRQATALRAEMDVVI